ncbi:hypothetical protein ACLM5J_09765 [Nocardioides sp. Bht2]|uniref:hypothetical protein n=1 Tax=Nocardioides sp. Bht2 TaxID=3392297 RepID=UPI0039B501FC
MIRDERPDEYDPADIEFLPRDELTAIVDGLLRVNRPDRYEPGADWLDEVAEMVENKITVVEAKRLAARQIVGQREGRATRSVNKFLKSLATDGGFRLAGAWAPFSDEPVAFIDTDDKRVRVALRAMRSRDWQQFTLHGRTDAQHRFAAEMATYDAADWLASQQGSLSFADWAQSAHAAPEVA